TVAVIGTFTTRQAGDDVFLQQDFLFVAHPIQALFGFGKYIGAIGLLGTRALQDVNVVSREIAHLEPERAGVVRQGVIKVGAGPIHHRHKVIANVRYTRSSYIAKGFFVVIDVLLEVAGARLDVVVQG